MAGQEPQFFARARRAGQIVVDGQETTVLIRYHCTNWLTQCLEPPKLDLEAYIANYRGTKRVGIFYMLPFAE